MEKHLIVKLKGADGREISFHDTMTHCFISFSSALVDRNTQRIEVYTMEGQLVLQAIRKETGVTGPLTFNVRGEWNPL